jgi:uncharacterized protein YodC (DUF2158 family)
MVDGKPGSLLVGMKAGRPAVMLAGMQSGMTECWLAGCGWRFPGETVS